MKKFFLVLISLIILVSFSSCIKIYVQDNKQTDTDTNVETETTEDNIDTPKEEQLQIVHSYGDKEFYPIYDLGNYYGSGFKTDRNVSLGYLDYVIIQNYSEVSKDTDYGNLLDERLFDNNYILAVKFLRETDKTGFIGFKDLRSGSGENLVTLSYNGGVIPKNTYFYLQVPKTQIDDWEKDGIIALRNEKYNYQKTTQINVPKDFVSKDAEIMFLSRSEMLGYVKENNLSIVAELIPMAHNYIICLSKMHFDMAPTFVPLTIENGIITLTRDYSSSLYKAESAYVDIIPVEIEDNSHVNKIELISESLNKQEFFTLDYKLDKAVTGKDNIDFYKTFDGGVYYGTELASNQYSSYTVIENYRELSDKAEFVIDKDIFDENYVLFLKLVNVSNNRLGFANAKTEWIDTIDGNGICNLNIKLYVTPIYDQITNDDDEQLTDKEYSTTTNYTNKVEYQYIVVPKSHIKDIRKTGELNIETVKTFSSYSEPSITLKSFDSSSYSLVPGDTWRITTELEMEDFNKKFGTSFTTAYLGKKYNKENIIVYLEGHDGYEIHQKAITETDSLINLSFLAEKNENASNENSGYFLCIRKDLSDTDKRLFINYTVITYGEYNSQSTEKDVRNYDFYPMELYSSNVPDWKHKVITDYSTFEEIFNTYKYYEIEQNITAENVFSESTFEDNYVIAFCVLEGGSGSIKNSFYNARVGGNKVLYLYSFVNSYDSDCMVHEMLYFVSIPKNEITKDISGIKVEITKETVYNGPFESVVIESHNKDKITLEDTHVIINSETELENILPNYKEYGKLQNVDFENNFILAFNRKPYYSIEYFYGDFVNFKTTVYGTASITFMAEDEEWLSDGTRIFVLDFVIIPKAYLKHEIKYFYIRYATYAEAFESDGIDRIELPDFEILQDA